MVLRYTPEPPRRLSRNEPWSIRLLAWLLRYPSRNVPRILVYHRFGDTRRAISALEFERQLQYLKERCTVVSLSHLVAGLSGSRVVPPNPLVITVDDGYADFYHLAFPLLRRYELPCTFFVTTGFVEGHKWLWPDKLAWLLIQKERFPDVQIGNQIVSGGSSDYVPRLWGQVLGLLREMDASRTEFELEALAKQLGLEFPADPAPGFEACTWAQLREMEDGGLIEVGGHTRSHSILSKVKQANLSEEINGCLEDLTSNLGLRPRAFCYPNGKPADFNPIVRDAVEKAGFTCACTSFYDRYGLKDLYALRRFSSSADFAQFFKAASGLQFWGARVLDRNNIDVVG